ncbi:toxin-antitoxin system YwqK family antitoxin [Rufibacter radiotolerans]|uniref:toxin-antitoxin system YwqK family antitoxin n=1 Tax=Rufibacter radiotolerans TaxID=1379910 RepID=UPI0006647CE9|nr:hypothetical protein [Rufibacter radiotolerans]
MLAKKNYANGQKVHEQTEDTLTYFFKNGKVKATGPFTDNQMQGEWTFYRETGQLWQVGHFKDNQKHGSFVRYDRNDQVEYQEDFDNGKLLKKSL